MSRPRVCLVEPSLSHEEVIGPQIELLHGLADVHVIAPARLLEVDLLRGLGSHFRAHPLSGHVGRGNLAQVLRLPLLYARIRRICADIRPDAIVFNTTFNVCDLALIAALFPRRQTCQIIHNYQQFLRPPGRLFRNWFARNLVLSEEVFEYIVRTHGAHDRLAWFLPVFFNDFLATLPAHTHARCTAGVFDVGVIGNVDQNRRNYAGLLAALRHLKSERLTLNVRVHIIGAAPASFAASVREAGLGDDVRMYGFCSFAEMITRVEEMDLVLFLIDRDVENAEYYNKYKISGTSSLLKAFRKVGVASSDFPIDRTLLDTVFTYPGTDIGAFLRGLSQGQVGRERLAEMERRYADKRVLDFATQQRLLAEALRLA